MKKVLLISNFPPSRISTGTLILEQFCRMLPEGTVSCFIINYAQQRKEALPSKEFENLPYYFAVKPSEYGFVKHDRSLGKLFYWLIYYYTSFKSFIIETSRFRKAKNRILNEVKNFADACKPDVIWMVLEGQFSIRMTLPIADKLKLPLYTQIWDPPGWWLRDSNVDFLTSQITMKEFAKIHNKSVRFLSASPNMARIYRERYQCETVYFLPSLDRQSALPPAVQLHSPGKELVIIIAGKVYAKQEFNALLYTLSTNHWLIAGHQVRLKILAPYIELQAGSPVQIEFYGWRDQHETLRMVNESDIAYCPYWFDPVFEEESRMSFPGKLTTYLAAGRPVFFHGPEYASPGIFLKENDAAMLCHSNESDHIRHCLEMLIENKELYRKLCINARAAFDAYLTMESMEKSFRSFLF